MATGQPGLAHPRRGPLSHGSLLSSPSSCPKDARRAPVSAPGSAHSAALSDGKDPSAWQGTEHRGEDMGKVGKEKTLQGTGGKPARQASPLRSTWKSKVGSSVSSPVMLS